MVVRNLWIDGKSLREFGIFVSGEGTYNSPEIDYETQPIPGLNGDLVQDNGRYKNVTVSYPAGITRDFAKNAQAARCYLLGAGAQYRRIQDDYHPDLYRMGVYSGTIDFETGFMNRFGETTLSFYCKPQRWLISGENPITVKSGQSLYNAWMKTKPLLLVTGNGSLSIGTKTITIKETSGEFYIDCELQDAWQGIKNLNKNIEVENHDWPILPAGETVIRYTGITQLKVIPRWWTL